MPERKLILIDGYSLLFRAFYGTRFLSTSDGRPTNALFGFTQMLFYALEKLKPDAIVVALDAPGKTFRHAEYAEYKGTRRETPPELISQLVAAREFIQALGIPTIEMTGYEADDVVGTLSLKAEANGYDTTIVSGDNDQLQLVDEHVSVLTPRIGMTDTIEYNPERVFEKYGVPPSAVPDWKAIVGDTSDNIPGVPGIGAKGATILLQQWGTAENLLEHLEEVEPKYKAKIEPAKEQLVKSKWLATIVRDAPVEYGFEPFQVDQEQLEKARAMLESLEMRAPLKRLALVLGPYGPDSSPSEAAVEVQAEAIEVTIGRAASLSDLQAFVGDGPYALMIGSAGAQSSMFDDEGRDAYVAIGNEVRRASERDALALFAENPANSIVHDAKPLFKRVETNHSAVRFDSMLAGYVLQPGRGSYGLRDLVQGYLDLPPPSEPEKMAAALWRLESAMSERLGKESQTKVLTDIEQPLTPVLAEMEAHGIEVSKPFLEDFSKSLEVEIAKAAKSVFEHAGQEFNIGSPKQLGEVLFEKLAIPGERKTKTGYATGAEVLQNLAPTHPIATEILNWRELTKLKSTYADSLPRMVGADGRIHTTYAQAVAATGRLSSNEPNLQNIPIRTELGRRIRKAFVAANGFRLASFDYSQIELRLLAHMCRDSNLVDAFQRHDDIHAVTASLMFDVAVPEVTKEQRRYAKVLNFAVLYGVTDFGLANQLGGNFSVAEARALIGQYYQRFPTIKAFTDGIVAEARAKGFTTTLCGRRRYFPDIHAQNRSERLYAERQAVNAPLQGTAADMIKIAMIQVRKQLGSSRTRMLLQVHDELVFELGDGEEPMIEQIRTVMERALPLEVPVDVDAKLGLDWNEMSLISAGA